MKEKIFIDYWSENIEPGSHINLLYKNQLVDICILYPGEKNYNFGPDIQNAIIKINQQVLFGDIEFHHASHFWLQHNHHMDQRYNNVILHIVNIHNTKIRITNRLGSRIKTFILIDKKLQNISGMNKIKYHFPCFYLFQRNQNQKIQIQNLLLYIGIQGIKKRIKKITEIVKCQPINKDYFNQLLFVYLFRGLGYYHNRYVFENRIKNINHRISLLYLKDFLYKSDFKNYGRPYNHPKRRISQFINFTKNCQGSFIDKIIQNLQVSTSFNDFCFQIRLLFNQGVVRNKIGLLRIKTITYNCILPVLLLYFNTFSNSCLLDKVYHYLLDSKNFEKNKILFILREKHKLPFYKLVKKQIEVQGLYYLYDMYCKRKRCFQCVLYKKLK